MAQLAAGVVGAAIGFYVGGPQGAAFGWSIGAGIGGVLFADTQKSSGPRLEDLHATRADYGSDRTAVRGRMRVQGIVLWASDKREIATTSSSGKGGPSAEHTSYTYEQDVLYEVSSEQIVGIVRIWSNGKLVWTKLPESSVESLAASESAEVWEDVAVYTGHADQLPDPTYEAVVGVGMAPAYRGRGTVMIRSLQLGSGGYPPTLEFDVLGPRAGSVVISTTPSATISKKSYAAIGYPVAVGPNSFRVHALRPFSTTFDILDVDLSTKEFKSAGTYTASPSSGTPSFVTSDISCGVATRGTSVDVFSDSGSATNYAAGVFLGHSAVFVAIVEGQVYIGSAGSGKSIYRFKQGVSSPVAVSSPMPEECHAAFKIGDRLYVVGSVSNVYILDSLSLSFIKSIPYPKTSGNFTKSMLFSIDGAIALCSGRNVWRLVNGAWEFYSEINPSADMTPAIAQIGNTLVLAAVVVGTSTLVIDAFRLGATPRDVDLADEVLWLCRRAGLTDAKVDASALAGTAVTGYAITRAGSVRTTIEMLATAYAFEACEDSKLRFRPRGAAESAALTWDDIGSHDSDDVPDDRLGIERANDAEIPARFSLSYVNVSSDMQSGAVCRDRIIGSGSGESNVALLVALTPERAQGVVDSIALDAGAAATTIRPVVNRNQLPAVQPTDVISVAGATGDVFRARVTRVMLDGMLMHMECALDDVSALRTKGVTDTSFSANTTVVPPADTILQMLDIPLLRDAEDRPGLYGAVRGNRSPWPGAVVRESVDGGATWKTDADVGTPATMGIATTALPAPPAWSGLWSWDEASVVRVDMGVIGTTGQMASSTREAMQADWAINNLLLGSEIVRFRTASIVSPGVYDLSGLLRGMRGTEWAVGTHVAGERAVILAPARGLMYATRDIGELGAPLQYAAVTNGRRQDSATPVIASWIGVSSKPFSPVNVRLVRDDRGDAWVTWDRRTRLQTRLTGATGSSVPLGEASEAYDVEIVDPTTSTVVQTYRVTEPRLSLSSASVAISVAPSDAAQTRTLVGRLADGQWIVASGSSGFAVLERWSADGSQLIERGTTNIASASSAITSGGSVFVASVALSSTTPAYAQRTTLRRFDAASLASPAAEVVVEGQVSVYRLASDAASLWVAWHSPSGLLERRDASTLAVLDAIQVFPANSAEPWRSEWADFQLVSGSTGRFLASFDGRVQAWDIATSKTAPSWSSTVASGSLAQVSGAVWLLASSDGVTMSRLDSASGALSTTLTLDAVRKAIMGIDSASFASLQEQSISGDGFMRYDGTRIEVRDGVTGAVQAASRSPYRPMLFATPTQVLTVSPPALVELSGGGQAVAGRRVRIYQISAVIGRGYPATADF